MAFTGRTGQPDADDAQELTDAFAEIPGWRLDHPTVRSANTTLRVGVKLLRENVKGMNP